MAALSSTSSECYVSPQGSSSTGERTTLLGPQLAHVDTWRSAGWDVMTHGGFLTFPHHDAGGLITFSYIRAGSKFWGYLHIDDMDSEDQKVVIKAWDEYYSAPMAADTYDKNIKLGTVLLERGAVL